MASSPVIHGLKEAPQALPGAGIVLSATGGISGDVSTSGADVWEVDVATTLSGMERLEAEWRRLEQEHGDDVHAFQSVDWCLACHGPPVRSARSPVAADALSAGAAASPVLAVRSLFPVR